MLPALFDIRAGSFRVSPRCAFHATPPFAAEHGGPRAFGQLLGTELAKENEAPAETLRLGLVPRRVHERVELLVRDARGVDVKCPELDRMRRTFPICRKSIIAIRPHQKLA